MRKNLFIALILACLTISLISCKRAYIESYSFSSMGTKIEVQLYEKNEGAFEAAKDIYDFYGQLTSSHKRNEVNEDSPYYNLNNIYLINKNAGIADVEVEKELIELLELSLELTEETNGYFNIGIGKAIDTWKSFMEGYLFQTKEKYEETVTLINTFDEVDLDKIVINKETSTVFLIDDSVQLNLGAISKGFATQLVYEHFIEERGIERFKINAGSSSIAIGLPPENYPLKTYIKDDNSIGKNYIYKDGLLGYIPGGSKHIGTSGSGHQYINVVDENKAFYTKVHHLISPYTLIPVNNFYKVTLVGDDSGLLDVYTTAVFLMPDEEAISFLEEKNIGYIIYLKDYSIATNLGEDEFVQYEIVGEIK